MGLSNVGDRFLEARIVLQKGRWRFWPDDEIRVRCVGRTNDLAIACVRLRDSGDVRFALLAGEAIEFRYVPVPFAGC